LKRFFQKDSVKKKCFGEAESVAVRWAFPKDDLNTIIRKLVVGSSALKKDRMGAMYFDRGAQR
jgi:hypothetical protein